jgi:hypothetical protein
MKNFFNKIKKTGEMSIEDPDIIKAVSTETKTKTGFICKILYIIGQIIENFKKQK